MEIIVYAMIAIFISGFILSLVTLLISDYQKGIKFHRLRLLYYVQSLLKISTLIIFLFLLIYYCFSNPSNIVSAIVFILPYVTPLVAISSVIITFIFSYKSLKKMENTKLQDIESKPYPKIKGIEIRLHHDKIIFMVYHSDTIYKFRFMAYDINGTPLSGEIIENIEDSINVSYDNLGIKIIDIINYVGNDSFPLSVQINSTLDNVSYISLEYYSKFFNHYIELYEIPKPKPAVGQYFAKIIQKKDPWMEKPWKSYNHRGYKLKNGILIIES